MNTKINNIENVIRVVSGARKIMFSFLSLTITIVLLIFLMKEISNQSIVINHFEVPENISGGLAITGRTLSLLLLGKLEETSGNAATTLARPSYINGWDNIGITVPDTGIDFDKILKFIRRDQKSIDGAVTVETGDLGVSLFRLHVKISGSASMTTPPFEFSKLSKAIEQAAIYVYRNTENFVYASSIWSENIELGKEELIGILSGEHKGNKAYSANGLGYLLNQEKKYAEALEWLLYAMELDPEFTYPYMNMARSFSAQARFPEAVKAIESAIDLDPYDPVAFEILGNVYRAMDDSESEEKAMIAFNRALFLNRHSVPALIGIGALHQDNNRFNDAISFYLKAKRIEPTNHIIFSNMGLAYRATGELSDSIKAYLRSVTLNPAYFNGTRGLVNSYALLSQSQQPSDAMYVEIVEVLKKVVGQDADDLELSILLCKSLLHLNRHSEAIDNLETLIQSDPNNPEAHYMLGTAYSNINDLYQAERAFKEAIFLDPFSINAEEAQKFLDDKRIKEKTEQRTI